MLILWIEVYLGGLGFMRRCDYSTSVNLYKEKKYKSITSSLGTGIILVPITGPAENVSPDFVTLDFFSCGTSQIPIISKLAVSLVQCMIGCQRVSRKRQTHFAFVAILSQMNAELAVAWKWRSRFLDWLYVSYMLATTSQFLICCWSPISF